ncbi:hypothetical protein ACSMEB_08060 [Stenotrophomonas maltophilia]
MTVGIPSTRYGAKYARVIWNVPHAAVRIGVRSSSGQAWAGPGYLAGEAPKTNDPAEPDGRLRILNQPAQGRIMVFERGSGLCVASTMSRADGTWRVDRLHPAFRFTVIGFDDLGRQNAAIQDWIAPAARE